MKNWKYLVQGNPKEVIDRLKTELVSANGFLFSVDDESASFNIRKPVKYPDQILHRNRIIAKGKALAGNVETDNRTHVEMTFTQDFYMRMTVFSVVIFGLTLILLITRFTSGVQTFLFAGIVFVAGAVLWKALQRKLERDTQKYKDLISKILES